MKLFIWFIIIALWCINYHIWISYNEKTNKKTGLLIIAIIIQIAIIGIHIWTINPLYYIERSFIYIFLDVISNGFILLALASLITCIICGTYKAIGHRYIKEIEQTLNYDILQFRTDTENADKKIDKFFSSHIFYLIFTIVCLWQIPLIFK
jgi:hypothetical protein